MLLLALLACGDEPKPMYEDSGTPDETYPYEKLSTYGFFEGDLADHAPAEGVLFYEVTATLWADNAWKLRYFVLPEGETATLTEDGEEWELPVGTTVIKTFYFPFDARDPEGGRRLVETRLLVREEEEWAAHVYLWDEEQTEAWRHLAGESTEVTWTDLDGEEVTQEYLVPNPNQCESCHVRSDVMHLLGPITHQMNREVEREGDAVDQISWLAAQGFFSSEPPADLPAFADPLGDEPVEARARSYLHANCSHCHQEGGGGGPSGLTLTAWEEDPSAYGVCKTPVAAGSGTGGFYYDIVPGRPEESILVFRMKSVDPDIKMPELPNLLPDEAGAALVSEWIEAMVPEGCEGG